MRLIAIFVRTTIIEKKIARIYSLFNMTIVTFKVPHTVLVLPRTIITIKLNFDMDKISSFSGTGIDLFINYTD